MSAGIVSSPTQQGVTKLPTAAHLRTNLLNGNVRVSSQTNNVGGQPAFYEITGGSITNNVKISLPALQNDDTLVTQNDNITWGGGHTFTQGLNSTGPIITNSSISGQSVSANNLTVTSALNSGGSITAGDTLTAKNHVIAGQNIQAGGTGTITGSFNAASNQFRIDSTSLTHLGTGASSVAGSFNAATNFFTDSTKVTHTSDFNFNASGSAIEGMSSSGVVYTNHHHSIQYLPQTSVVGGMTMMNYSGGSSDTRVFGIVTGSAAGLTISTTTSGRVSFYGLGPIVQSSSHGNISASTAYTTTEEGMLNDCYQTLRGHGFMA